MNARMVLGTALLAAAGCSRMDTGGVPREFMNLPLLVVEDFDTPCPERWEPTDPQAWQFLTDGERTIYGMVARSDYKPRHRSPEGVSILKDVYVSDFVLDVWWRSMTRNYAHRDMCIFFGHQDPARFYYVHFGLKADDASNTIHIVNNAPRTPIVRTRTDGTAWTEGYHHARVVRDVESGLIEAYFDDMTAPAMTAQDTTFQWGRIGLGSFDDTGYIDRIILWGRKVARPVTTAGCPIPSGGEGAMITKRQGSSGARPSASIIVSPALRTEWATRSGVGHPATQYGHRLLTSHF